MAMCGWRKRRQELLDGLKDLTVAASASSSPPEQQLHLALLAAEQDKRGEPGAAQTPSRNS
jgi:hypothetical protein